MKDIKGFTPGPWKYEEQLLMDNDGKVLAKLYGWSSEQRDINGEHIAKYPTLYAENQKLREVLRQAKEIFEMDSSKGTVVDFHDRLGKCIETINELLK